MSQELHPSKDLTVEEFDSVQIKTRVIQRLYRAVDYLSIYTFICIVYGSSLIASSLLFQLIWFLLSEEVATYPTINLAFHYARIALALLSIVCAVIHGIISTYSQIKLDLRLAREDES